jgi:hypothetical protein
LPNFSQKSSWKRGTHCSRSRPQIYVRNRRKAVQESTRRRHCTNIFRTIEAYLHFRQSSQFSHLRV